MFLFSSIDRSSILSQVIPLSLTVVVLAILLVTLRAAVAVFNLIPFATPIVLQIRLSDVLVGGTIYLKTAIDFAIFMGRLMSTNPGWKKRVAIEVGTAAGNAMGTILIIGLWVILKDIHLLLALMVLVASLVLFELAYGSLEHVSSWETANMVKRTSYRIVKRLLLTVNRIISPILSRIMPDISEKMRAGTALPFKRLLVFSASVPFILGLDDFAGYVPLFTVVNVYGFAIGVIAAHTLLTIFLFLSPKRTIAAVKNEYISFAGALAFIGLALYGLWEAVRIVTEAFSR